MQSHILVWWHWFIFAGGLDYSFQLNLLHRSCLDNKHIKGIYFTYSISSLLACCHVIILHCIRSVSDFCRTATSEKQLNTFVWYLQLWGSLEFNLTFDRKEFRTQLVYLCINRNNLYFKLCLSSQIFWYLDGLSLSLSVFYLFILRFSCFHWNTSYVE